MLYILLSKSNLTSDEIVERIVTWMENKAKGSSGSKPSIGIMKCCQNWRKDGSNEKAILEWVIYGQGQTMCPKYIYKIAEGLL